MELISENLKEYVLNKTYSNGKIQEENILSIEELVINRFNLNMEEANFEPDELEYFKKLKMCSFSQFTIRDKVITNLNRLNNLEDLTFDHCRFSGSENINNKINNLKLNCSDFKFLSIIKDKETLKEIFVKNVKQVDIKEICEHINLEEIQLLNCEIVNSKYLEKLSENKKIEIIGCKFDDTSIIDLIKNRPNVSYSDEEYFPIG